MNIDNVVHPEGKIKLLDGTLIEGYPIGGNTPIAGNTDEERELFLNNAFFLLSRAKRILSDSRMFLAPIDFGSGLAYSGYFAKPTLGIYIEWWQSCAYAVQNDGEDMKLVYRLAGSPLSGMNHCSCVDMMCKSHTVTLSDFSRAWLPFARISSRYKDCKQKYQHYTIQQVIDILRSDESSRVEDELFMERLKGRVLETKKRTLRSRLTSIEEDYRELKEKYHHALIRLHLSEMTDFYKEYKRRYANMAEELKALSVKRSIYKREVQERNISAKEAQWVFCDFKKQKAGLKDGLKNFVNESLMRIIPEEQVSIHTVLDFFWDYKQETNN